MEKYIMALDQGTTSSRCIIFNKKGEIKAMAQMAIKQLYSKNGWVEEDAFQIYLSQVEVAKAAPFKKRTDLCEHKLPGNSQPA
ncbi:MAG: hypothetical protein LBU94_05410 [Clostridiales bacterium]|nr:hypothetical protein [Clostridiales bacterium]